MCDSQTQVNLRNSRHPLFPLLALLLEKCEEATRGEVDTRVVLSSLENDVRAFVQHERDGNKTLMTDDAEVDGLVNRIILPHKINYWSNIY